MDTAEFNDQSSNLHSASSAAADSLVSFETAMDRLVDRLEITGGQIQKLMEIKDRAEVIVDRVAGFSQSAVDEVKKSPKSFLALGLVLGWLIWSHSKSGARSELQASPMHH